MFLTLLDLLQQKTVRTDGLFNHLVLFFLTCFFGDGNQPVRVIPVFLSVLRVDTILQSHTVLLARLPGDECFGVMDRLSHVWSRINPPAINLTTAWLLKTNED